MDSKLIDTFKQTADQIAFLDRGYGIGKPDVQSAIEEVYKRKTLTITNVKDFGAVGDGVTDDTQAIQTALDTVASPDDGTIRRVPTLLYFPEGTYRISDTLRIERTRDYVAGLHIIGAGVSGTIISQSNKEADILRLATTSGNFRSFIMENIYLTGGRDGISTANTAYLKFNNITFNQIRRFALRQQTAQNDRFYNCWWVHTAECAYLQDSGTTYFENCLFGEDVGRIMVSSAFAYFNFCFFHDNSGTKTEEFDDPALFNVREGSWLSASNCKINVGPTCRTLVYGNGTGPITFSNCEITIPSISEGHGVLLRYGHHHIIGDRTKYSPIVFRDNNITFKGDGRLYELTSTPRPDITGWMLRNSMFVDNQIRVRKGKIIQVPDYKDSWLIAGNNVVLRGNHIQIMNY